MPQHRIRSNRWLLAGLLISTLANPLASFAEDQPPTGRSKVTFEDVLADRADCLDWAQADDMKRRNDLVDACRQTRLKIQACHNECYAFKESCYDQCQETLEIEAAKCNAVRYECIDNCHAAAEKASAGCDIDCAVPETGNRMAAIDECYSRERQCNEPIQEALTGCIKTCWDNSTACAMHVGELWRTKCENDCEADHEACDIACDAMRPPGEPAAVQPVTPAKPPPACTQVTEEIAKFDGKRSYSRCQDNYVQLRPTCQAPTEPPQEVPVDCRTVEYAPGKFYAGCDQSSCTKTRTRTFEELLEAIGHGDRYPIPERTRLKNFLIDLSSAEWALLKERQGEIRPLYWEGLLWARDQMAWESDQLLRRARVYGVDELRRFHESVRRRLHEEGLDYEPYAERLYEQAVATAEQGEAYVRQQQELEKARRRAEAAEERYKVLEEQRQRLREYEQMSELDKWRTIVRDNTPGLRLINPEHRKVVLDPESYPYQRMDAAWGPMMGDIPVIGNYMQASKALDMARVKLTDPKTDLTWTDVGVSGLSAIPGVGLVGSWIDIYREDSKRWQENEKLRKFWEEQRRLEDAERQQRGTP